MQEGEDAVTEGLGERGGRVTGKVGGGATGCEFEVGD